jgi:Tropinone reductase 1
MPSSTPFSLGGKTALITGASKGIGRATTQLFLELGAEVIAVARQESGLVLAKAEWEKSGLVHLCPADVATEAGRAKIVNICHELFAGRGLDVLVNNVGINIRKPVEDYPLSDLQRIMSVNVEGAFELSKALKPVLAKAAKNQQLNSRQGSSSIINVSSVSSLDVVGTSTIAYAMSKGALDNMTRWLGVSWAAEAIRVNSVHPWYTYTELTRELLADDALAVHVKSATPLGRIAEAAEVANAIAFLAMPAASYITASQLIVDGGYLGQGIKPLS